MKRVLMPVCLILVLFAAVSVSAGQTGPPEYLPYPTKISWSPDGAHIAVSGFGLMQVFDVITGKMVFNWNADESEILDHDWSIDSNRLAFVNGNTVQIRDVSNGQLLFETAKGSRSFSGADVVHWSADGTTLMTHHAFATGDLVYRWNAETYGIVDSTIIRRADHPVFSPNAEYAIASSTGYRPTIIRLDNTQKSSVEMVGGMVTACTWNDDASLVAIGHSDGRLIIWDVTGQAVLRTFQLENSNFFYNLDWASDNTRIAAVTEDFAVQVWNVETGEVVYETDTRTSFTVAFSPYGGRLAFSRLWLPGDPNRADAVATATSPPDAILVFGEGIVRIAVPDPSLERLAAIHAACASSTGINIPQVSSGLNGYLEQISRAGDNLSPACAADLIAVAEAIMAETPGE